MAPGNRKRLDWLLTNTGVGSRKDAKDLIRQGRVSVNGAVVKDSSIHVHLETDAVEVDGERVTYREFIYILMNKPAGVISATEDMREETVVSLLPRDMALFDPFPVGRLDKDTEGLLILTNDGQLAHSLLSPKRHVPKTYFANIHGTVSDADAAMFKKGIKLDDGYLCRPADLTILRCGDGLSDIELTIVEGKFHQVKRMFQAIGKEVTYLKRIQMGSLRLDDSLAPGAFRELTVQELERLRT